MTDRSYPDFEPAWVEDAERRGSWSLRWLGGPERRPGPEIGVLRESDVPGIHTYAAAQKILSMPLVKQAARLWGAISAPETPPED